MSSLQRSRFRGQVTASNEHHVCLLQLYVSDLSMDCSSIRTISIDTMYHHIGVFEYVIR